MTGLASLLAAVGWLDWTLGAVLLASIVVGLLRGVVFELLSLVGWVVAWFAAQWAAPRFAAHVPIGVPGGGLNHGAAFLLAFVAALVAWAVLARLVRLLVRATPLSAVDRLLGALFGVLRGLVLLLALASAVIWTPAAQSQVWRQSLGARWLGQALAALAPLLPRAAQRPTA